MKHFKDDLRMSSNDMNNGYLMKFITGAIYHQTVAAFYTGNFRYEKEIMRELKLLTQTDPQ